MGMKCIPVTGKVMGKLEVPVDKLLSSHDIKVPFINGNIVVY